MGKQETKEIESQGWSVGKVLGQGAFGKVMLVTRNSDKQQAAVKIVKKPNSMSKMELVKTEAKILKSIQHPYIVLCFDAFETTDNVYFVMELMSGGEARARPRSSSLAGHVAGVVSPRARRARPSAYMLSVPRSSSLRAVSRRLLPLYTVASFSSVSLSPGMSAWLRWQLFDRIVQLGMFTEKMAQDVTYKLLGALQYMHDQNVCHRDLKPENMLLSDKTASAEVKITDFGLSKMYDEQTTVMKTACGTPGYCAPEVLAMAPYDFQVDVWSYGVILYILLCGFPPFYGDNDAQLFKKVKAGAYKFIKPYWDPISAEAKDFVSKTLIVDPRQRAKIPDLLKHPWLAGEAAKKARRTSLAPDPEGVNLAKQGSYPIQETAKKLAKNARLKKAGIAILLANVNKANTMENAGPPEDQSSVPVAGSTPGSPGSIDVDVKGERACQCVVC